MSLWTSDSVRRLAAVDVAFLGPKIILAEFTLAVFGSLGLGVLTLARSHSGSGRLFGAYLVCLGINYVPLLLYSIDIVRRGSAHSEIADESGDRQQLFRKYRRLSLWLMVPLAVPAAALAGEWRRRKRVY
jgi:hypothetical protein